MENKDRETSLRSGYKMVSKYLVYAIKRICDSRIVYVGKSGTYLHRPYSHLVKSSNKKLEKILVECDRKVEIVVLEECSSDEEALNREDWWIHHHIALGHPLANKEAVASKDKKHNRTKLTTLRTDGKTRGLLGSTVATARMQLGYTQPEFAKRVGVGVRFIKELELGKPTVRLDKVEQVLYFIGYELTPTKIYPH